MSAPRTSEFLVEEILPGYRLGERGVRPARVVVNRHSFKEQGAP